MVIYKDFENTYKLLDYHITHSRLLFRSMRNRNREYNIEILFKPVYKMVLTDSFNGLEISLCKSADIVSLISTFGFTIDQELRVFCLKELSGKKYYVNAMVFGVFHNQLGPNESSIKGLDGDYGEKQLWFDHQKELLLKYQW